MGKAPDPLPFGPPLAKRSMHQEGVRSLTDRAPAPLAPDPFGVRTVVIRKKNRTVGRRGTYNPREIPDASMSHKMPCDSHLQPRLESPGTPRLTIPPFCVC